MQRHYYVSDSLETLALIEQRLHADGIAKSQVHVLSDDHAEVERREINEVHSILRSDLIRSGLKGAALGFALGALCLGATALTGIHQTLGWVPFIFLAIVLFGFCTWEGGLFGIQEKNSAFERFEKALAQGQHILMVDVHSDEEPILQQAVDAHKSHISVAALAKPVSSLFISTQARLQSMLSQSY